MKKLFIVLSASVVGLTAFAQKGRISEEERSFLRNNYEVTTSLLQETLDGISQEEWTRRPSNGGWSPADCMEHIILAMPAQLNGVKKALAGEANNEMNLKARDGFLLSKITDRGVKVKTPLNPKGSGQSKEEMMEIYQKHGVEFLQILDNKKAELRNHFGKSPYGDTDAYQLMIFIPGHVMRHLNQIQEVLREVRA